MTIELSESLERALEEKARAAGLPAEDYVSQLLERDLEEQANEESERHGLKSGLGVLAKYGPAPSAEEIDENRREMSGILVKTFDLWSCCRHAHCDLVTV